MIVEGQGIMLKQPAEQALQENTKVTKIFAQYFHGVEYPRPIPRGNDRETGNNELRKIGVSFNDEFIEFFVIDTHYTYYENERRKPERRGASYLFNHRLTPDGYALFSTNYETMQTKGDTRNNPLKLKITDEAGFAGLLDFLKIVTPETSTKSIAEALAPTMQKVETFVNSDESGLRTEITYLSDYLIRGIAKCKDLSVYTVDLGSKRVVAQPAQTEQDSRSLGRRVIDALRKQRD
jgi:hypothetical protein